MGGSVENIFDAEDEAEIYDTAESIYGDDDRKMESLANIISRSTLLNERMKNRQDKNTWAQAPVRTRVSNDEFVRPYVATGEEMMDDVSDLSSESDYYLSEMSQGQTRASNFPRVTAPWNPAASWNQAGPSSRNQAGPSSRNLVASTWGGASNQESLSSVPGALNPAALAGANPDEFWDPNYNLFDKWDEQDRQ